MHGSLDDLDLLETEAAGCDIFVHCASAEDLPSTQAIARGLAQRRRRGSAYWIAVSGIDTLAWRTVERDSFGEQEPDILDDDEDLEHVQRIPDHAPHRDVEKAQLAAASDDVKIAIVSPSCIYGVGRGPGNKRSIQLPDLANFTLRNGHAFQINRGLNRWSNVHIHDLSDLFVRLVRAALDGGGNASWGEQGYYFAENGVHVWKDLAHLVAGEAVEQGHVGAAEVVKLSPGEARRQPNGSAALFYGTDAVCCASRARRELQWKPNMDSIESEVKSAVMEEAQRLRKE